MTYLGVWLVAAVVMQLFLLDSVRLGVWFAPMAYVAFVVLLPVNTKPVVVLLLGFLLGAFMDVFEGTQGLHTAATLVTAYTRQWVMRLTIGKEAVEEETGMPSVKLLGGVKFLRYVTMAVAVQCVVFFALEALDWGEWVEVAAKVGVSGAVTVGAVWAVAEVFTARTRKKV